MLWPIKIEKVKGKEIEREGGREGEKRVRRKWKGLLWGERGDGPHGTGTPHLVASYSILKPHQARPSGSQRPSSHVPSAPSFWGLLPANSRHPHQRPEGGSLHETPSCVFFMGDNLGEILKVKLKNQARPVARPPPPPPTSHQGFFGAYGPPAQRLWTRQSVSEAAMQSSFPNAGTQFTARGETIT